MPGDSNRKCMRRPQFERIYRKKIVNKGEILGPHEHSENVSFPRRRIIERGRQRCIPSFQVGLDFTLYPSCAGYGILASTFYEAQPFPAHLAASRAQQRTLTNDLGQRWPRGNKILHKRPPVPPQKCIPRLKGHIILRDCRFLHTRTPLFPETGSTHRTTHDPRGEEHQRL